MKELLEPDLTCKILINLEFFFFFCLAYLSKTLMMSISMAKAKLCLLDFDGIGSHTTYQIMRSSTADDECEMVRETTTWRINNENQLHLGILLIEREKHILKQIIKNKND